MNGQAERKEKLKQRLREKDVQLQYHQSIFDALPVMVVITDGDDVFDANHAFSSFFAKMGVDVYSEGFSFPSFFQRINKYGYVYDGFQDSRWYITLLEKEKEQYRVVIQDGETSHSFNISLSFFEPLEDVFIVTLTNVTDLVGYKNALEEGIKSSVKDREKSMFMLRQYDRAIDASTLVLKLDLEGKITYVNKALTATLKYTPDELIGQTNKLLNGPSLSDEECRGIMKHAAGGEIYHGVIENRDKEGGLHYFDLSVVPLIDMEGNVVEYLSIRHEITEVMRAKEEAVKTLEAKTKFFDQVSHELRTPLNAIINFTDQSLESFDEIVDDPETRALVRMYIERSHINSEHLLHLINSMLDMAKLNAGKEKYQIIQTEVNAMVKEVYEGISGYNKNKAIEFVLTLSPDPITVECDDLKCRQILTNLISNAFKFTEWGFVEVRVRAENDECIIEVEDSGIGIPKDKMGTIFDPFEQVGAHDQGTGLGLGIVSEYCKGMGIVLEAESELGAGSCFRMRIPMNRESTEQG